MKNYILDTNVLLHDPNSLGNFQENHLLIPIEVIEEIDKFKREPNELGQNARVGEGTKIVFTGDPYQIDNPYVDSSSNGFNYIVSKFQRQPIAAHIELQKGERSELAEIAANLL